MGSDKSHFNVSLIVRDTVTNKAVSTDQNLSRERRAEAASNRGPAYQSDVLPLGQTGSLKRSITAAIFIRRLASLNAEK